MNRPDIKPLGEDALLLYCVDEASAVDVSSRIRSANPSWLRTVYPAYASVGLFFNAEQVKYTEVCEWLDGQDLLARSASEGSQQDPRLRVGLTGNHTIPVCYEMQQDMARVTEVTGLSTDKIIQRHTATTFTVYAVGFVPGFPYMGYLPPELAGVGRLPTPRVRVEPGSVGITGRQTGIYPLARPGGWNLIGRTPLTIVDVADRFFPIAVGDTVNYERIDETTFAQLQGERLS